MIRIIIEHTFQGVINPKLFSNISSVIDQGIVWPKKGLYFNTCICIYLLPFFNVISNEF